MGCTGSRPKPRNTQGSSTAAGKADVTQKVENSAAQVRNAVDSNVPVPQGNFCG